MRQVTWASNRGETDGKMRFLRMVALCGVLHFAFSKDFRGEMEDCGDGSQLMLVIMCTIIILIAVKQWLNQQVRI
jgi:hypothetical protein